MILVVMAVVLITPSRSCRGATIVILILILAIMVHVRHTSIDFTCVVGLGQDVWSMVAARVVVGAV